MQLNVKGLFQIYTGTNEKQFAGEVSNEKGKGKTTGKLAGKNN